MKKIYFFTAVITLVFLTISCEEDDTIQEALQTQEIMAKETTGDDGDQEVEISRD